MSNNVSRIVLPPLPVTPIEITSRLSEEKRRKVLRPIKEQYVNAILDSVMNLYPSNVMKEYFSDRFFTHVEDPKIILALRRREDFQQIIINYWVESTVAIKAPQYESFQDISEYADALMDILSIKHPEGVSSAREVKKMIPIAGRKEEERTAVSAVSYYVSKKREINKNDGIPSRYRFFISVLFSKGDEHYDHFIKKEFPIRVNNCPYIVLQLAPMIQELDDSSSDSYDDVV